MDRYNSIYASLIEIGYSDVQARCVIKESYPSAEIEKLECAVNEACEIIQMLKHYSMIHTITGVVYPEGSHEYFIGKATKFLEKYRK